MRVLNSGSSSKPGYQIDHDTVHQNKFLLHPALWPEHCDLKVKDLHGVR